MIESEYTRQFNKRLPAFIKSWKINDNYQGGVPDAYYFVPHAHVEWEDKSYKVKPVSIFCEFKYLAKLPVKPTTVIKPDLSKLQVAWLTDIRNCKALSGFVILASGNKGVLLTLQQALDGITTEYFLTYALPYQDLADKLAKEFLDEPHFD